MIKRVLRVIIYRLIATFVLLVAVVVFYTVADTVKQDPVVIERVVVVTATPASTPTPRVGYNRTGEGLSSPSLDEWLDMMEEK